MFGSWSIGQLASQIFGLFGIGCLQAKGSEGVREISDAISLFNGLGAKDKRMR